MKVAVRSFLLICVAVIMASSTIASAQSGAGSTGPYSKNELANIGAQLLNGDFVCEDFANVTFSTTRLKRGNRLAIRTNLSGSINPKTERSSVHTVDYTTVNGMPAMKAGGTLYVVESGRNAVIPGHGPTIWLKFGPGNHERTGCKSVQ